MVTKYFTTASIAGLAGVSRSVVSRYLRTGKIVQSATLVHENGGVAPLFSRTVAARVRRLQEVDWAQSQIRPCPAVSEIHGKGEE